MGANGLYIWMDLRDYLPAPGGWDAETMLQQMLAEEQIVLAPGNNFMANEPGFFRMGLGWDTAPQLSQAIDKMAKVLDEAAAAN